MCSTLNALSAAALESITHPDETMRHTTHGSGRGRSHATPSPIGPAQGVAMIDNQHSARGELGRTFVPLLRLAEAVGQTMGVGCNSQQVPKRRVRSAAAGL